MYFIGSTHERKEILFLIPSIFRSLKENANK